MQMTGAEVMVKCLAEQGVTTVFGYPGGAILPFYDALRESDLRHILTAHEQALPTRLTDMPAQAVRSASVSLLPGPARPIWSRALPMPF